MTEDVKADVPQENPETQEQKVPRKAPRPDMLAASLLIYQHLFRVANDMGGALIHQNILEEHPVIAARPFELEIDGTKYILSVALSKKVEQADAEETKQEEKSEGEENGQS